MSQDSTSPLSIPSFDETTCDPDLMLVSATAYIDRGWRVFPLHSINHTTGICTCGISTCRHKGEHPMRPAGVAGATTRPRDVLEWWEDDPTANIGIATGAGLLVIAVAPERELTSIPINPLPQSGLVSTGNGGWHLYFTYSIRVQLFTGGHEGDLL